MSKPFITLLIATCFLLILPVLSFSQDFSDLNLYQHSNGFGSADTIIAVKGHIDNKDKEEYDRYFENLLKGGKFVVKSEMELDSTDLKKHLLFFGTFDSYTNLEIYTPPALSISENGFNLGPYSFTDTLDVIYLYSNDSTRLFHIGNSMDGVKSIWTTFAGMEQYMIMQNHTITHHGFLVNGKFDTSLHVDMIKERNKILDMTETEHYIFRSPKNYFSNTERDSLFRAEDEKFERILKVLELELPQRKIECYIYEDKYQKLRLSFTPGFGNTFTKAWQNHSIGFGAVEHESIHILFDNQTKNQNTFLSEGVMGYYHSALDSNEWKKDRLAISLYPDLPVKELLTDYSGLFWTMNNKAYPASAHFAKFLIDTYGLVRFKQLCAEGVWDGFLTVYNKSIDQIVDEWGKYVELTKLELEPERQITFRVISKVYPDSSVYIVGDHEKLGNWNPSAISLIKQTDGSWSKTIAFYNNMILNFKITRGSWDKEAVRADGKIPSNSVFEIKGDSTFNIVVENWKDSVR